MCWKRTKINLSRRISLLPFHFYVGMSYACMMYICRWRLYGSDITARKKGCYIVKVIKVYSWFLYHIFRCIIWRGVAFFEKLPPSVILRMLSDKMVSQSLHFWLLILGTGKSIHTKHISKVHIFWEGHKILRNLHLTFNYSIYSQK